MSREMAAHPRFMPQLSHKPRFPYECLLLSIEDMVRGSLKMYSNVMKDERSFRGTCGRRSGVVKKVVNG